LPEITDSSVVILLIAVFGILTTVELLGFVALNIVKLKAPSAFVAFFVILIVGPKNSFSNMHSAESPAVTLKLIVVFCETPFTRQSDASRIHPAGMVSVTE